MQLACLRLDLPANYAKGFDDLPAEIREAFEGVLVRSLDVYHDLINATFREQDVRYFVDRRRTMAHHPLLQFVRAILKGAQRNDAISVPQRAVMEGPQGKMVYVLGLQPCAISQLAEMRGLSLPAIVPLTPSPANNSVPLTPCASHSRASDPCNAAGSTKRVK